LVTPEPSTHSPPMKFFRIAVILSSIFERHDPYRKTGVRFSGIMPEFFLTHEAGTLVVEGPAGDQVLHGDSVIAGTESMLLVELMRRFDGRAVDYDADDG